MGIFNAVKFQNLVLYISKKSEEDPRFGAVKLNKLLYYCDFYAYRQLGEPITHASYQKLREGPAPKEMLGVRRMLVDAQKIELANRPYFDHIQQRISVLPGTPIQTDEFSAAELALVDEVIAELWSLSGKGVSDRSHAELGWIAADFGEVIPYETAWLDNKVSQEVEEFVHEVAASLDA